MSDIIKYQLYDPKKNKNNKERVLGSGFIGGKATGLSFAEDVLEKYKDIFNGFVKIPEGIFISTEYYDSFIRYNNFDMIDENLSYDEISLMFREAEFPDDIKATFMKILDKMEYPLAIRSSSYLEDNIKYSFAGKYHTTFITNKGSKRERLIELERAIKEVYLSVFGPDALEYRKKHANDEKEQMGVIIQRLIGEQRGIYFYPEISGVGFSKNYRRWTDRIKVDDGVIRVVFGLGTKCTGRGYARIFSLTNLKLRPEGNNPEEIEKNSQESFDVLNLVTGDVESYNINDVPQFLKYHTWINEIVEKYLQDDRAIKDVLTIDTNEKNSKYIFTFKNFARKNRNFFNIIEKLFNVFEKEMGLSVDIEFTYSPKNQEFYLLQVRPLSSYEVFRKVHIPKNIEKNCILLKGDRMLTNGVLKNIPYILYVDPYIYSRQRDKFAIARIVGRLNKTIGDKYILIGPGRWGSSNPILGVPVIYNDISNAAMIVEIGISQDNYTPELSYGTHFFADLDAEHILYLPVFDGYENNVFNYEWFRKGVFIDTGVKIFEGHFDAYLDGEKMLGYVVSNE